MSPSLDRSDVGEPRQPVLDHSWERSFDQFLSNLAVFRGADAREAPAMA